MYSLLLPRNVVGICIGCIVAKTNILMCVIGTNVPTCFRKLCVMLDTMFQHPGTVQCAMYLACLYARLYYLRKQYFHILLTKQRAYHYMISCGIFLKLWLYFRKYLKLSWTILKMFWHFRNFHICLWFLFCRSDGRSVLFWSPSRLFDPSCFSIKGRH